MKKTYLILLTLSLLFLAACSGTQKLESENYETKNYDLEAFNAISVGEGIEVILHKSFEHRADASSNFMDYLKVKVGDDGVLSINFDKPFNTILKKNKTRIEVWGADVSKFKASSSAQLKIDSNFDAPEQFIYASSSGSVEYDVNCEKINIEVSSSGNFKGEVKAKEANLNATSSGEIRIKGSAKTANLMASSSGKIDGKAFTADVINAEISSSGDVKIGVMKELNASVSSSGDLHYKPKGSIQMNINKSSGGRVKEINGIF